MGILPMRRRGVSPLPPLLSQKNPEEQKKKLTGETPALHMAKMALLRNSITPIAC
jgi:hypothetical protein